MSTSTEQNTPRAAAVAPTGLCPDVPGTATDESAADRFMRRLLRVERTGYRMDAKAHRRLRMSLVISGVRCLITYLLIPILVPIVSVAGLVAAPVSIALCAVAVWSGISSLRRFFASHHRGRWMYTWFIVVVFAVLAVALTADVSHLMGAR